MLRDQFHKRIADWCEDGQMEYVAEVPGVRMTTQLHSHIPGGDSAHEKLGSPLSAIMEKYAHSLRHNPKMGSSLSRQLGRKRALIECFHSIGWSMTLQDARWMIDWMAVLGTNMFNFHAFFYSIDGLRKHDAAPSQFEQNPYWRHFGQLGDYIGRLSYMMSEGSALIDIAVLDPTTSLWTQMGNPFHQFKFAGTSEEDKRRLERMKTDWIRIQTELLIHQRDYDTLDPEMLMQARISEGALHIGAGSYKVLIIPPITNLEAAAWERVQAFVRDGGTVISVGLLPYETIEPGSEAVLGMSALFGTEAPAPDSYWSGHTDYNQTDQGWIHSMEGNAFFVPYGPESSRVNGRNLLIELLNQTLPRRAELVSDDGSTNCLLMQHRQLSDREELLFIANHEGLEKRIELRLADSYADPGYSLSIRDLENGETWPLSSGVSGKGRTATLVFAPYQSHLVEISRNSPSIAPAEDGLTECSDQREQPTSHIHAEMGSGWAVEAAEPNTLRLGRFLMALDLEDQGLEQQWQLGQGALNPQVKWYEVDAKTWISQCADLADELPHTLSYSSHWFGTPFQVKVAYPVIVWFQAGFDVEQLPELCELRMDREAILGEYRLFINGTEWDGGRVTPILGSNTIMIRVVIQRPYDGVVDPLYLSGPFGVRFTAQKHPVITSLPTEGDPNNAVLEGFPHYSGTFIFRKQVQFPPKAALTGQFELSLSGLSPHFHDCAELVLNGHSLGVRAWTPYVWTGKSEWLAPGSNLLELRVDNPLCFRLDGTYFDYARHEVRESAEFKSDEDGE